MRLRSPVMFAGAFVLLAAIYSVCFNVAVWTHTASIESRYTDLSEQHRSRSAASYGERLLEMRAKEGADEIALFSTVSSLARIQFEAHRYDRASELYERALASPSAANLTRRNRAVMESQLAKAYLIDRQIDKAVAVYATFLAHAGDNAARPEPEDTTSLEAFYAELLQQATNHFAEGLKPVDGTPVGLGREAQLTSARLMTELGAFYSMRKGGQYAAAGLLSSAYSSRKLLLGAGHPDTVQLTLILGPVYVAMGRLTDAESLYLDAFHAQERLLGSNSPDLSLYIKLLAGIYEKQSRNTEAQALNVHMRAVFRDAFGTQRYAINRTVDRRDDYDRPVSQQFLLSSSYSPHDLVAASAYSVPVGKPSEIDEMKVRLAADEGADPREANMPVRLAQLISLCRSESNENLALRSGYRSFKTQQALYDRLRSKGTVTPPGMSEHQTGLAADINVANRLMRASDRSFQCFEENGFRFGFILSYPPGNDYLPAVDSFEPWHWRYVGVQTAHLYREAGPYDKPQEFLAALPCYRALAAKGDFPTSGEADICITDQKPRLAQTDPHAEEKQLSREDGRPARILNDLTKSGGSR